MKNRGTLKGGTKVVWTMKINPAIQGGVVYQIGDILLDASTRSLQNAFFSKLDAAGIKRVF
jgi:carbon monoxide dehydrogenase subunit G